MRHLVSKASRRVLDSVGTLYRNASCSSMVTKHHFSMITTLQRKFENMQKNSIPSNLLQWGSLGFYKNFSFATGFTPLKVKPLETIMDVERAKKKSPEELRDIWDDYHLGRGHIGLSMKSKLYHLLEQRAADCRYFVIPLWKGSGYSTMFVQVQMPHILFTGLEDYKARGTQAAPYLTASYYKEFADSKDLVLVRGDVVFTSKLSDEEAKWLLEAAQSFYLYDVKTKEAHVKHERSTTLNRQRWRNRLILNNIVTQSTRLAAATTHLASLHSTNALFEKWKNKFNFDVTRDQGPSKIKFTVREKRAEAKKDLKGLLYNGGCSTSRHEMAGGFVDQLNKKSRMRPAHHSKRAANKKLKRKHQRENPLDSCGDDPANTFFSAFGKVGPSWTFKHWDNRSEWAGNFDRNSRTESQDKSFTIGTFADRKILGLPTTGHLKIEDVKAAFRSSALKWHPDRHQGSSQAVAEEKFKHCVDAYKSLCKSHSSR